MSDAWQVALWVSILLGGLAVAGALARLGLAPTHVRDVLHVGAGVWPLGWPAWHSPRPPLAIAGAALAGMALLPLLAQRLQFLAAVQRAVSGEDERWSGLVLYAGSAAVLTGLGLLFQPFPAAAAFFALALGDGVGGAVGLGFGRLRFQLPGGKRKSLEGSLTVALFSSLGVLLAAYWFAVPVGLGVAALAGLVAALAESVAPRATDNVLLPAAVWAMLAFYPRVS
jgi:dolichol kinase